MKRMLMPLPWQGRLSTLRCRELDWLHDIRSDMYCALWQRWPEQDLPVGHDFYAVSFHLEVPDLAWIQRQADRLQTPILVMSDCENYNIDFAPNVTYMRYLSWHTQIEKIKTWFTKTHTRTITHKASAICHRITQSKLLIFTALAELLGADQCFLKLSDWLEDKNVHSRASTGVSDLDQLSEVFWQKYFGKQFVLDDFDQSQNWQSRTADPWQWFLQDAAVNFTNESFHYSLMHKDILPGPFLTEKTLRCLVGGIPFVPVGQFDTFGSLSRLGLEFHSEFDCSWDQDPGNLTRLQGIINLIKCMKHRHAQDIRDTFQNSIDHNEHMIWSGEFCRRCCEVNTASVANTVAKFRP